MTNQTPEAKSNPFFQVGDKVPDVTLRDENGQEVALASFWEDRPALLVFLRHFG